MRASPFLIVFAASAGCLINADDLAGRRCKGEGDCPEKFYRCEATMLDGGRTCEVIFPPVHAALDGGGGGGGDAGVTPTYCREMKDFFQKYCFGECHNDPYTGSGILPGDPQGRFFRADCYDCDGGPGVYPKRAIIRDRVLSQTVPMPPRSYTFQPSDAERQLLSRWVQAGAPNCDGGQ